MSGGDRRLDGAGMRRDLRGDGAEAGPGEVAWSPLDTLPAIFADSVTAQRTVVDGKVSALVDQGSAGVTFAQGTAGMRPVHHADEWGAGLDAMGFEAGQILISGSYNPNCAVLTLAVVGELTPAIDYSCMFGLETAATSEAYIIGLFGTAALYTIHRTNVGYSQRMGTTVPTTPTGIVSRHTISDASEEGKLWVEGSAEDAGNNGNNANNTSNFGAAPWAIGGRAASGDLFATGKIAAVMAWGRALTAQELSDLTDWSLARVGR